MIDRYSAAALVFTLSPLTTLFRRYDWTVDGYGLGYSYSLTATAISNIMLLFAAIEHPTALSRCVTITAGFSSLTWFFWYKLNPNPPPPEVAQTIAQT